MIEAIAFFFTVGLAIGAFALGVILPGLGLYLLIRKIGKKDQSYEPGTFSAMASARTRPETAHLFVPVDDAPMHKGKLP